MFAYCLNNPIKYSDPSGNCACTLNPGLARLPTFSAKCSCCGGGIAGGAIGTAVTIDLVAMLAELAAKTAAQVQAWVEAQTGQREFENHSVYVLRDPDDGLVKYVGRTNDPTRRASEHKNDLGHPWRSNYEMTVLLTGLTMEEARIYEQIIISAYTRDYLENARREISVANVSKFTKYVFAATEILTGLPAEDILKMITKR